MFMRAGDCIERRESSSMSSSSPANHASSSPSMAGLSSTVNHAATAGTTGSYMDMDQTKTLPPPPHSFHDYAATAAGSAYPAAALQFNADFSRMPTGSVPPYSYYSTQFPTSTATGPYGAPLQANHFMYQQPGGSPEGKWRCEYDCHLAIKLISICVCVCLYIYMCICMYLCVI